MIFGYKEEFKKVNIAVQDLNLSTFCTSGGKLDTGYFDYFFELFTSKIKSEIKLGFKALIQYAKEGDFDLFINSNMPMINILMIDTAFDTKYDFLKDTLLFYKWVTLGNPQQLKNILDEKLIEFFYSIYNKPSNLICKSYIYEIFTNILTKNQNQFYSFINKGYQNKLSNIFWEHFEFIEESDDDSRVIASILKFLPVFYLNNDVISFRSPSFFDDWGIAFSECFKIDNWIITPALTESLQKCTNILDVKILYKYFFIERYFSRYFQYCVNPDHEVRINMISTFLNFAKLETEDLLRIVDAGLFNIGLLYDETGIEEIIQFLNVMHQFLLKSNEIAAKVAYSKILFDVNSYGISLTLQIKDLFFIVLAQLIRICQKPILIQVFNLCPLYIELASDLLEAISDNHKIIILHSFFDLFSYLQIDKKSELSTIIRKYLFNYELFQSLNDMLNNFDSSSEEVNSLLMSLIETLFPDLICY